MSKGKKENFKIGEICFISLRPYVCEFDVSNNNYRWRYADEIICKPLIIVNIEHSEAYSRVKVLYKNRFYIVDLSYLSKINI